MIFSCNSSKIPPPQTHPLLTDDVTRILASQVSVCITDERSSFYPVPMAMKAFYNRNHWWSHRLHISTNTSRYKHDGRTGVGKNTNEPGMVDSWLEFGTYPL